MPHRDGSPGHTPRPQAQTSDTEEEEHLLLLAPVQHLLERHLPNGP